MRSRNLSGKILLGSAVVIVGAVVYIVHEQQNEAVREMRKGVERDKERLAAKKLLKEKSS